ncbi:unnamed protein product [Adineta steineri]|uniref:HAT C-terminal dimerisation domain-containing protein n=1 Tax=Adineta steineri TaxID=433720 RepID=A0A816CJS0_9BILA|nr:unnamed protein product [Adineta steineri]CAF1624317.1 unnamed protein product [Adineta steineri]
MDYSQSNQRTCEPSSSISSSSTSTSSSISSSFTSTSSSISSSCTLTSSTSSSLGGSCISSSTASSNTSYTRENIQHHLKYNKAEYVILNNSNNKNSSVCWRSFGFPAKLDINGVPQKINNFVSCKNCFTTYSYISNSTTFLMKHNCLSSDRKTNSTLSSSCNTSSSQTLITTYGQPKTVRLPDSHSKEMKDLLVRWICKDVRPFAIVDDDGFRKIAQRCVSIGAQYGNIDINQILRSSSTISSHIHEIADNERARLKDLLALATKNGSLCLCPDLWTDNNRQCSYLGITASFVDDEYQLHNIDLCCHPFPNVKKTAENIIIELEKALSRFEIIDLHEITFVSDRGANFLKALKRFQAYSCAAHRLNNIVKCCFFVNEKNKKQDDLEENVFNNNDEVEEDIEALIDVTTLGDIPKKALQVLENIIEYRSFFCIRKVLANKKKNFAIEREIVQGLIRLLLPFKELLTKLQTSKTPSLHLVLIGIGSLRTTLSSFDMLLEYEKKNKTYFQEENLSSLDVDASNSIQEDEGLRFFRLRLSHLIEEMFSFEPIHYASTMLHPKYRHLKKTSSNDKNMCKYFIRQMMKQVINREKSSSTFLLNPSNNHDGEPCPKKRKHFGEEYETGNVSDEYDIDDDELERYLSKRLDLTNLSDNPLDFWKNHKVEFPVLAKVACQVFSVPATSACVERSFSTAGNIATKRRTNIKPTQLNNVLFLRSSYSFK